MGAKSYTMEEYDRIRQYLKAGEPPRGEFTEDNLSTGINRLEQRRLMATAEEARFACSLLNEQAERLAKAVRWPGAKASGMDLVEWGKTMIDILDGFVTDAPCDEKARGRSQCPFDRPSCKVCVGAALLFGNKMKP